MNAGGSSWQRLQCGLSLCFLVACVATTQSRAQVYISTSNGTALKSLDAKGNLRTTFHQYGELADAWLSNHNYGFLTFKDESAAAKAIDASPIRVELQHDIVCSHAETRHKDGKTIHIFTDDYAPLNAIATANELRLKMRHYGKVADVWISEKHFAFVTFEKASDATKVVAASPIRVKTEHDILCSPRWEKKDGVKNKGRVGDEKSTFLRKMIENQDHANLEEYISSGEFREDLKDIAQTVDPATQQQIRDLTCLTKGICSSTGGEAIKLPLVLFHGPPGTGKTEAMKLLANESGLTPWVMDMKGLPMGYGAEDLFAEGLKQARELSNAIVFFDECERLFTRRSVLAEGSSVMAQVQKRLVSSFIEFADGLETDSLMSKRVIFVFATNLKDDIDPAILDRVWKNLLFELPRQSEFTTWWSRNARHLNDGEHAKLGTLSVGLSYRKVKQIAHQVLVRAARKEVSFPGTCQDFPSGLRTKFLSKLPRVTCQDFPSFQDYELEFVQSGRFWVFALWVMEVLLKLGPIVWTLKNFEFLVSRVGWLLRSVFAWLCDLRQ